MTRIIVNTDYRDLRGHHFPPGEHDVDPVVAHYLVSTDHAEYVDEPTETAPQEEPAEVGPDAVPTDEAEEEADAEFEKLTHRYTELYGHKPAWNISLETLRERVAEAEEA